MELVGRWWNNRWRHGRRDIWLYRDVGDPATSGQADAWVVRAREGGDGGRELTWPPFAQEWQARAWVDRLISASPGTRKDWKDMIRLVRREPPGR